jgi:AraC-like DNA-binding protein
MKFSDFEALRESIKDTELDVVQIGKGPMSGEMNHFHLGTFGISAGSFSRGIRSRGNMAKDKILFATVDGGAAPGTLRHQLVKPGDLMIVGPNQEIYFSQECGSEFVNTWIDPAELVTFLEDQKAGSSDLVSWQDATVLAVDPAIAAGRIEAFRTLISGMTQGAPISDGAVGFYKRNILELLAMPILSGIAERGERLPRSAASVVRDIDRYLIDAGARPVHISELLQVFNVSKRTLHRYFKDVMGVGVIAFARNKRLCNVHSALLKWDGVVQVKDVLREHGFLQGGQAAEDYRRLFGENPSDTQRRSKYGHLVR